MENSKDKKQGIISLFLEIFSSLIPVLKSKYVYISLLILATGVSANLLSQIYLHANMSKGAIFPPLSDLILDRLPVLDVSLIYDLTCIVIFLFVIIYIIHKKEYGRIPYILLLTGIFFIFRGIFVVLTPLGNPANFEGSDPLFNGFMKYELGVYPSGHVGNSFLLLLLVNDKIYRYILSLCLLVVVVTLLLAHCHYSIDILSGFFFAYAIKTFGDRHLNMFVLKDSAKTGTD